MTAFTNYSYTSLSLNIFMVTTVEKYQIWSLQIKLEEVWWGVTWMFKYWRTCHMKRSLKKGFGHYREEKTHRDLIKVSQYQKRVQWEDGGTLFKRVHNERTRVCGSKLLQGTFCLDVKKKKNGKRWDQHLPWWKWFQIIFAWDTALHLESLFLIHKLPFLQ